MGACARPRMSISPVAMARWGSIRTYVSSGGRWEILKEARKLIALI